jgi:glycosyltransferase involved in cell wall biosynthesis
MKVAIDSRTAVFYKGTGIGTYTLQLINNLIELNKITIDIMGCNYPNNEMKKLTLNDIKNTKLSLINLWESLLNPRYPSSYSPDIIHIPQNGIGIPTNVNCKIISTLHDIIPITMPETVSPEFLKVFNNNIKDVINKTDIIITVSEFSKRDIYKNLNVPKEKIFVTYLAANPIFRPISKVQTKKLLQNKFKINKPYLLFVGGYSPRKNLKRLLEAFSLLNSSIKNNYNLVILARKVISYEETQRYAEKLNIINSCIFIDYVEEIYLPYLYNGASIFLFPSLYEGFGLPILEAMACGTPVISSDLTSLSEILGNAALKINPYDSYSIKDSIETLLEDTELQTAYIEKGFNNVSKFSWKKTAIQTMNIYKTM